MVGRSVKGIGGGLADDGGAKKRLRSLLNRVRRSGGGSSSKPNDNDDDDAQGRRRRGGPATALPPPPDAAGYSLGRALGDEILSGMTTGSGTSAEALEAMCSTPLLNPAVPRGYFAALLVTFADGGSDDPDEASWSGWVLRCEELTMAEASSAGRSASASHDAASEVLTSALRSYAARSVSTRHDVDGGDGGGKGAASTYRRLKTGSARRSLLRECATAAFRGPPSSPPSSGEGSAADDTKRAAMFLSPLLAASTLNPSAPSGERSALMGGILRECSAADATGLAVLVPWLTRSLEVLCHRSAPFLIRDIQSNAGSSSAKPEAFDGDADDAAGEMAYDFFLRLVDSARRLSTIAPPTQSNLVAVSKFLNATLQNVLPRLACGGSYRYPLVPALDGVSSVLNALNEGSGASSSAASDVPPVAVSDAAIFRTAILGLTVPDPMEAAPALRVLREVCSLSGGGVGDLMRGVVYGVGCIHADSSDGPCAEEAGRLLTCLKAMESRSQEATPSRRERNSDNEEGGRDHLMGLLQHLHDNSSNGVPSADLTAIAAAMSPPAPSISDDDGGDGDDYSRVAAPMTAPLQSAALLIGVALHRTYGLRTPFVPNYLRSLLGRHPRLGLRLLPVMIRDIRDSISSNDPRRALSTLRFLCESPAASDPDCASQIWSVLGELTSPRHGLSVVIASTVRLYPGLVRSNRKLYGRVRDSLAGLVAHPSAEVRLAGMSTVAELAEGDLIRDAGDAAPWIQGRLSPRDEDEPAVVYYALMGLHHFIRNGEMEFDSVIKALNRRMACRVDDVPGLLKLDGLVLEGLVTVLGDGECGDADDDSSDSDEEEQVGVSAQVRMAVRSLVALGLSPALAPPRFPPAGSSDNATGHDDADCSPEKKSAGLFSSPVALRLRHLVRSSLASYSAEALGLDALAVHSLAASSSEEGGGKADDEDVGRLRALRTIALGGALDAPEPDGAGSGSGSEFDAATSTDALSSLPSTELAEKLLAFEQEALGASLFKKAAGGGAAIGGGGATGRKGRAGAASSRDKNDAKKGPSRSALAALPNPESVRELYRSDPATITSVAALLSFESSDGDDYEAMLDDLEELASDCAMFGDVSDPIARAVALQGWIQAMGRVWGAVVKRCMSGADGEQASIRNAAKDVMERVLEWTGSIGEPDVAYVALAALALCVPDRCGGGRSGNDNDNDDEAEDLTGFVESVRETIASAQRDGGFDHDDAAHLCLGVVGARLNACQESSSNSDAVADIAGTLVDGAQSEAVGGQFFGALYGLGLIVGSAPPSSVSSSGDAASAAGATVVRRIIALLLEELHGCLAETCSPILAFAASVKSGSGPTQDLRAMLRRIKASSLQLEEGAQYKFRSVCLSLAQCSATLGDMDRAFLQGLVALLEKFPPGAGCGVALSSAYQACSVRGIDLGEERLLEKSTDAVEKSLENGNAFGLDDAIWTVSGVGDGIVSKGSKQSDAIVSWIDSAVALEDVQVSLFIAFVGLLGLIPSLTPGRHAFGSATQLRAETKKEIISHFVEALSASSTSSSNSNRREGASLALGLLSGMKSPPETLGWTSSIRSSGGASSDAAPQRRERSGKKQFPKAREGSLLKEALDLLDALCPDDFGGETGDDERVASLLRMLAAVSLPGESSVTVEWLLKATSSEGDHEAVKVACVGLLLSQIKSRQRFGLDGREFVQTVARLSKKPYSSFISLLGSKSGPFIFVSSLREPILKLPSGSVKSLLESIWPICLQKDASSLSDNGRKAFRPNSCVNAFLCSLCSILKDAGGNGGRKANAVDKHAERLIAPATLTYIQSFVVDRCFPDLVASESQHRSPSRSSSNMRAYFECARRIPLSRLDEKNAIAIDAAEGTAAVLARIRCIAYLARRGYFEEGRRSKEIVRAASWIARQTLRRESSSRGEEHHELGLVSAAFDLAFAAAKEGEESRKNTLFHIFEVMLVEGYDNMSIQLLGFLLSFWKGGARMGSVDAAILDTHSALPSLFVTGTATNQCSSLSCGTSRLLRRLFLEDLPYTFSLICADLGISGGMANRVSRVLGSDGRQVESGWPLERFSLLSQVTSLDGVTMTQDVLATSIL